MVSYRFVDGKGTLPEYYTPDDNGEGCVNYGSDKCTKCASWSDYFSDCMNKNIQLKGII